MIPIDKAIQIVNCETRTLGTERVTIDDAVGRIVAENIVADTDLPPFDRSQMDGYAVKAADVTRATTLKIVGESAAGRGWHKTLKKGEAVRIMTGAPVPTGGDTIAKLELTDEKGDVVHVLEPVKKGTAVVKKGAEIKYGNIVIKKGERTTPNNIASIAAFGYGRVPVTKRPRIAILATGSEIVDVSKEPKRDQIRNSNSVMLKALCEAAGAHAEIVKPTGDDLSDLKLQISDSIKKKDILIVTGGVSVGKYDLTKAALINLGAEIFFDKLRLKPGKPAVFARLKKTLIFGLPGNPVSAAVTFYLLVRHAIMLMQRAQDPGLRRGTAILTSRVKADRERDTFLPAVLLTNERGQLTATSLRSEGSSDLVGFAGADSLIYVEAGQTRDLGSEVEIKFL